MDQIYGRFGPCQYFRCCTMTAFRIVARIYIKVQQGCCRQGYILLIRHHTLDPVLRPQASESSLEIKLSHDQ